MQRSIEIDIDNNVYYQNNSKLFLKLLDILRNSRRAADVVKFNNELNSWINEITPLLKDPIYNIQTKIYWIINNLQDFPKCQTCGEPLIGRNVFRIFKPRYSFCNCSCAQLNSDVKKHKQHMRELRIKQNPDYQAQINEKRIKTVREKYGVDFVFQSSEIQKQTRKTILEKYGVDHIAKSPKFKEAKKQYMLEKYGVEFYFQTDKCKEKMKNTMLKRYGVSSAAKMPNFKEKIRQTKKQKYGKENYVNIEKIKKTKTLKYGDENYVNTKKAKQTIENKLKENPNFWHDRKIKTENTCMKRYGVKSHNQLESVKRKKEATCLKHYGVLSQNQSSEVRKKQMSHYLYDKLYFDSKPELSLYIYLTEHNINFIYQPQLDLSYEFNGTTHMYFPDFMIENQLVEIKGSHMIDQQTGKWICPWNRTLDELYEAKHQYIQSIGVKILYSNDYKKYIDYINDKYGKNYLKQFKCVK